MTTGSRPRIALVNPPSDRAVLRDYYCSTFPKTRYHWHPIDLLALGAQLEGRADVLLLDAMGARLSRAAAKRRIELHAPDAVFGLVSALTEAPDLAFLRDVSASGVRRVAIAGEVALDPAFDFVRNDFVDGLILDFTGPEAADFLLGDAAAGRVRTATRDPDAPPQKGTYRVGQMPHVQLTSSHYSLPLTSGTFYSLLTDFGCPWACTFCNSGRHVLGYKVRDLDEVAREILHLGRLGAERVYLRDMTFGANREHATRVMALLTGQRIKSRGFLRADVIDEDFAQTLGRGGFELAQIGIEAPSEAGRRAIGKKLADGKLSRAFALLRDHGVAAGGHFVVGLAGEPDDAVARCVRTAEELGCAYVSINVYEHRHGCEVQEPVSSLRRRVLARQAQIAMLQYNGRRLVRQKLASLLGRSTVAKGWERVRKRRSMSSFLDRERY